MPVHTDDRQRESAVGGEAGEDETETRRVAHHPVDPDKVLGLLGPNWKLHVAHGEAVLAYAKLVLVAVDKHLWQIVELWDQLLLGERVTSDVNLFPSTSSLYKVCCVPVFADPSYLDVSRVPLAVPPRAADPRERSFRMVELVLIGVEEKCGERLLQAKQRSEV